MKIKTIWVMPTAKLNSNGFYDQLFLPKQFGVVVQDNTMYDAEFGVNYTYELTDDGVKDWVDNEYELTESDHTRLKNALAQRVSKENEGGLRLPLRVERA